MNKWLLCALSPLVVACVSKHQMMSQSAVKGFELAQYQPSDLKDAHFERQVAFVFTLLYHTQELNSHRMNGQDNNTVYVHDFMSLELSSLLYGLSVVAFYCLLAYVLYQRKIFIKV